MSQEEERVEFATNVALQSLSLIRKILSQVHDSGEIQFSLGAPPTRDPRAIALSHLLGQLEEALFFDHSIGIGKSLVIVLAEVLVEFDGKPFEINEFRLERLIFEGVVYTKLQFLGSREDGFYLEIAFPGKGGPVIFGKILPPQGVLVFAEIGEVLGPVIFQVILDLAVQSIHVVQF